MIYEFHPAASEEFIATVDYYEAALPGLGAQFRDAVRVALELVYKHPQIGRQMPAGWRRVRINGFPYDIVHQASDTSSFSQSLIIGVYQATGALVFPLVEQTSNHGRSTS